ncbi:LEAF RUST 10 DISEASE-RESISTANCE LOCUS RECEPTOR-LIKE PROTEIN KINASE-like 1.1 [Neltuma alba]|uniref:LEAF RUST 10 DISEASE-RESISTANCE LOCUS RECEPTOR-LIKE PROTEIN KINASE-like 1.1 n=1 Tax=Neltuma alba TaxID=207710 RepID=UPI0010A3D8D0|nr:LEAF RUST 10 DISEASE-RESISTANCE LOCUS RECEPTOR-LIKE PROTEIN KINASE-like 1.1 [Prosopis alba]
MVTPDSVLPLLCLCCFLLPFSVACPTGAFPCGHLGQIHFPFFDNTTDSSCGLLPISGCDDPWGPKRVQLGRERFQVEQISQEDDQHVIMIRDPWFQESVSNPCSVIDYKVAFHAESLPLSFSFLNGISLLKCDEPLDYNNVLYRCDGYCIYYPPKEASHWPDPSKGCSLVQLPIFEAKFPGSTNISLLDEIYIQVHLSFSCLDEKCGAHELKKNDSKPMTPECKKIDSKSRIIGVAFASAAVIVINLIAILLWNKRRYNSLSSQNKSRSIAPDNPHSNAILESGDIYFRVPVFSYEELEETTEKFDGARELGRGGFGTVYYGKLKDGREVAIKRLFERNPTCVQQFMNEVKILTRLCHRNLVSLYGCTSHASHELLLVYEYIPNGTLGCHLHGNLAKPGSLQWSARMRIALETANALSYLHACGIIHRDVKSSNLLLDHHFCVKVADFGISRLFPKFASHVSTPPAGTIGYLDPEYHQFYQLTEKSDVYSFGVVLIELISSKPAIINTRDNDKISLANMAVKKIQRKAFNELIDPSLGFETEDKVKEMIISVANLAFQCLQRDGELRPSMDKVMGFLQKIQNGEDDYLKHLEFHRSRFSNWEIHTSLPTSALLDGSVGSLNNSLPQCPPHTV